MLSEEAETLRKNKKEIQQITDTVKEMMDGLDKLISRLDTVRKSRSKLEKRGQWKLLKLRCKEKTE